MRLLSDIPGDSGIKLPYYQEYSPYHIAYRIILLKRFQIRQTSQKVIDIKSLRFWGFFDTGGYYSLEGLRGGICP